MAITKEQKTQILQGLVDKFGRSKSIVFSDYRGLDVASVSDLRNRLREKGAETKVAKKTLIRLAAKESNAWELGDNIMEGPVSATFSYEDEMAGLKVLFKFSKENENLKLLGGIINGEVIGADEIIQLAKLPGREELLAKFIGSVNAPVSGFVGTLSNLVSGFVRVLNAYKDSLPASAESLTDKPAEGADPNPRPEEKEEAPKEEVKSEEVPETPKEKPADEPAAEETPDEESAKETTDDTAETSPKEAGQAGDDAEGEDNDPREEEQHAASKEDETSPEEGGEEEKAA